MFAPYQHTQVGWVILISLLGVGALGAMTLLAAELVTAALVMFGAMLLLSLLFGTLTVTVDKQHLVAKFGIGLIRKKIELSKVRAYDAVCTPWYYGWGIRIYPGGILYNVSGLDSVEFIFDGGKRCRIGTDEPDELKDALRRAIGELPPLPSADLVQVKKTTRRFVIGTAIVPLVIFGTIGAMMAVMHQEPKVEVETDALVIDSLFYGQRYPITEIRSVSLESNLPAIRVRTNGYALAGKLRGYFKVDRLGKGKLFIDRSVPPFVVVQTNDSYVVFNLEDPQRTEQAFQALRVRVGSPSAR